MTKITFDHEKLAVYRFSIDCVAQSFDAACSLSMSHRHARDQRLRAAQSNPLNITEGNGRRSLQDRNCFLDIVRRNSGPKASQKSSASTASLSTSTSTNAAPNQNESLSGALGRNTLSRLLPWSLRALTVALHTSGLYHGHQASADVSLPQEQPIPPGATARYKEPRS